MPSPSRFALSCSVLSAAALTATTFLAAAPAYADPSSATGTTSAGAPSGELPLVDGDVVSHDSGADRYYDDPNLPERAPTTGDDSPGATMGQYQKSPEAAKHLSDASKETRAKIKGDGPSAPSEEATGAVGPAGAMSLAVAASAWQPAGIQGMDVSGWQPAVNWSREYGMGARFAYVKATEGTGYRSPTFNDQYIGSYQAGMTRGAYHFALPIRGSSGAQQADYFVDNGGGWSADGRTLPGLLDIEYNPYQEAYGNICFDRTQAEMVDWIEGFSTRYEQRTGRPPAIYSTTDWWAQCTGNTSRFNDHPLMIAAWNGAPGPMPNGWSNYDIWQYSESGPFSGDSNVFGGNAAKLRDLAVNPDYKPIGGRAPVTPQAAPSTGFRDVPANSQFASSIQWAKARGYLTGWSDGTFRPGENIHRDAMAAVAYRMAGSPAYTPPRTSPYRDVSPSSKFYKEIAWARQNGLLTGWRDGTFRPTADIDRDATAALFHRMAGSPATTAPARPAFSDVPRGHQFYREIHWFQSQGITTGWRDGTFRPGAATDRDAMAAFLHRYAG